MNELHISVFAYRKKIADMYAISFIFFNITIFIRLSQYLLFRRFGQTWSESKPNFPALAIFLKESIIKL